MSKINIVDLFCGGGGETTGIVQACEQLRYNVDLLAINHWEKAIETHKNNYPEHKVMCESIEKIEPTRVIKSGRLDLLWASPECTHHSNAAGGRPKNEQSRASAWLILKWLTELYVDRVIIENVSEFLNWGPLGADLKPLKSRKGETFMAFVNALKSIGYKVDWRLLCAADYGDPTTRKRLFIQAVRGRKKITWPEITHIEQPTSDLFQRKKWIPAKDIIDWSISGKSIFKRKKPLAENTLRRIEIGIKKYWGDLAEPFLIILRGQSNCRNINSPVPTVSCSGGHIGVIEPMILHQMSGGRMRTVSEPVPTITTTGSHALIEPLILKYYGSGENVKTSLIPLDTVTTKDRFAIIEGVPHLLDIRFRMLQPHELAAAQGFPDNYKFSGNRTEVVKQIGNAVPCNLARELVKAVLAV